MMRTYLAVACIFIVCSSSLFSQNAPTESSSTGGKPDGVYASGFRILNKRAAGNNFNFDATVILSKVRDKWYPQIPELQKSVRQQGTTEINFEIQRDGSLGKLTTVKSAGDAAMDSAASESITSAAPFAALPDKFPDKTLKLEIFFGYDQPANPAAPFCDGPDSGAHTANFPLHKIGHGVTPPRQIYNREPEFSEQARRDKYMSLVVISGTVDPQGAFTDLCVTQAGGEGLDERAIEAAKLWKFQPATLQGEPVAVRINAEMSFRLY